jgi:hypothetical protein
MQIVIADFESVKQHSSGDGLIHTICLMPCTMQTGKFSQFTLHTNQGVVIKINDVLKHEIFKLLQKEQDDDNIRLNRKHGSDINSCAEYGIKVTKHMNFYDAIKFMNKFIVEHGGIFMTHNFISDLEFIVATQNLVKGRRIVKNKLAEFPDTGMYDKNWESITKVCSMSLFCNRCPKMISKYKQWAKENGRDTGMNKLESLTQFVKGDREYREKHAAVQDTVDLFTVLKYAYKCDGPIMDGYSYLSKPNWVKAI